MSTPTSPAAHPDQEAAVLDAIASLRRATFAATDLLPLSDLSRRDAQELARAWSSIPLEARIGAVRMMAELSEDLIEVSFGRALRVALGDVSPIVRQLAIDALWEDEGADLSDRLLDLLRHDESVDVRAAAAQGLARFADQAALDALDAPRAEAVRQELLSLAGDARQPYLLRRRSLEAGAVFGARPEVADLIWSAYEADDPGLRAGALYAMGRTQSKDWLSVLLGELESPDAEMRYEAARACGSIGDDVAVVGLVDCAQDADAEVRQAAIDALGQIGGRAAQRVLHGLVDAAPPADREAIQAALDAATDESLL